MNCANDLFKYLCKWVLENCSEDMKFVGKRIDNACIHRLQQIISGSPELISYNEAVDVLRKVGISPCGHEHIVLIFITLFLFVSKITIFFFLRVISCPPMLKIRNLKRSLNPVLYSLQITSGIVYEHYPHILDLLKFNRRSSITFTTFIYFPFFLPLKLSS